MTLYDEMKYRERRSYEDGKSEGRAEGKLEGKAEGKLDAAKKMKEERLPSDLIVRITGLSMEEIEKL